MGKVVGSVEMFGHLEAGDGDDGGAHQGAFLYVCGRRLEARTAAALLGTNALWPPCCAASRHWTNAMPHMSPHFTPTHLPTLPTCSRCAKCCTTSW